MSKLLLVPLDDIVVFPNMNVTLTVDVGDEERVLLVPKHEGEYATVGTVARVTDRVRLPGGAVAVALEGLHRGVAGAAETDSTGRLLVEVEERRDGATTDERTRELEREYRAVVEEILELRGDDGRIQAFIRSIGEPGTLADTSGYSPDLGFAQKVKLLETVDVTERLELALSYQRERLSTMQIRQRIREDVDAGMEKQQREYLLRKQMDSIRKELGEDDASVVEEYRAKIAEADMPEAVREQADKELGRFERMGEQSPESQMIRSYLDWLLAVPWGVTSDEVLDPIHTREVLDSDHEGLEDVKDRIVEYIAVAKLRKERGIEADKRAGAILTLIGPPGTGKTSIGESVAKALNREFVRMSLGGVRDEAEIRGHRRTYIGALPGPSRAGAPRRQDDEPGHPAGRGRQGRRRLARRPVGCAPRGARSGAELDLPRPLPRRRGRPLAGLLPRDGEHRGDDPRAAARPDGGHPLRRLHDRREGRDRARVPLAAPARAGGAAGGRGLGLRPGARDGDLGVHPRGRRPPARARARLDPAEDRDADRLGRGHAPGGRRSRGACAMPSVGRSSGARPRSAPRFPVSPPDSPSTSPAATCSSSRRRPCRARGSC